MRLLFLFAVCRVPFLHPLCRLTEFREFVFAHRRLVGVSNITPAGTFGGAASLFANYEEKVALWGQISTLGPRKRAANLLLNMSDVARKVCMSVGKGAVGNAGEVAQILKICRDRFVQDTIDSVF